MMSPAFSSKACDSLAICSATLQIIWFRSAFCLTAPLTFSEIAPLREVAGLRDRVDRPDRRRVVEALADLPRLLLVAHAALQVAPRHVEADRVAVDEVEGAASIGMLRPPDFSAATSSIS